MHWWIPAALFALTFLVFIRTAGFDFINLDDPQYVQDNDRVKQGLSWENIRWAFTTFRMANWHPLTWLSYMLDAQIFGDRPAGYHVVNVIIHSANAALLYLVLASLTAHPWRAAAAAALFAVHPLRMESVAWVAERKDVLCAFFFIAAIGCYGQYVRHRSRAWYGGIIASFVLGMLAKPMVVTLPCVLLLLDYWPLRRPAQVANLLVEKVPLFALALVSSVVTYIAQQRGGATDTQQLYPLALRLGNAVWAYARYLKKTIWPNDLAIFYPYPGAAPGSTFPWLAAVVSAMVLIAITVIALRLWQRQGAVLIGWLWFLGVAVPTIGLVQVGMQSMADRYSYLPHIGLFIALVWCTAELLKPKPAAALAGVAVVTFAACTVYQLGHWRDSGALYSHALRVTARNSMANTSLGMWENRHGRPERAMAYFREALKIDPSHGTALTNLGGLLHESGDLEGSYSHLRAALDTNPKSADAHNNMANVLADRGLLDRALEHHAQAVQLDPESPASHYNYAVTLARVGRFDEAIARLEHALRLRPDYTDARFVYAMALAEAGRMDQAKQQFNRVVRERPGWIDGMARFARLLATSPNEKTRDPETAVALAEHLNKITLHQQPVLLDTLAAALASAGRFDDAVATAQRARDAAEQRGQGALVEQLEKRIELYRSRTPFVAATQPTTQP